MRRATVSVRVSLLGGRLQARVGQAGRYSHTFIGSNRLLADFLPKLNMEDCWLDEEVIALAAPSLSHLPRLQEGGACQGAPEHVGARELRQDLDISRMPFSRQRRETETGRSVSLSASWADET